MKRLLCVCLAVLLVLAVASCGAPRIPITSGEFRQRLEEEGFSLENAITQFPEGAVDEVWVAVGETFQMEFYIVPTVEQAVAAFNENRAKFEERKGAVSSHVSVALQNYSYYKQSSDGQYFVVSRIENTFVYVVAPLEEKQVVDDALKLLGY